MNYRVQKNHLKERASENMKRNVTNLIDLKVAWPVKCIIDHSMNNHF